VRIEHDVPEAEKQCPCDCTLIVIGEDISEQLDIILAKIQVQLRVRKNMPENTVSRRKEPPLAKQKPPQKPPQKPRTRLARLTWPSALLPNSMLLKK